MYGVSAHGVLAYTGEEDQNNIDDEIEMSLNVSHFLNSNINDLINFSMPLLETVKVKISDGINIGLGVSETIVFGFKWTKVVETSGTWAEKTPGVSPAWSPNEIPLPPTWTKKP